MWRTLIILLSAANFFTTVIADAVIDEYSNSSSSSSSFSSSYSSSQCNSNTEDTVCTGSHEYFENCNSKPDPGEDCVVGCHCENNYARNKQGNCILKTQFCRRQFEVFSDCVNGGCDRRNCTQLKDPEICIDVLKKYCIEGCVCKSKYLRNNRGVCVPINKCPEKSNPNCRGPNEYYENCASDTNCKTPCVKGCRCIIGYVKNDKGNCVVDNGQCSTSTTTTTPKPTTATTSPQTNVDANEALKKLYKVNLDFSLNFLKLITAESAESKIASPFSVLPILIALAFGTSGDSYAEFANFFNISNQDELAQGSRKLIDSIKERINITLLLGQKIYVNEQYELNDMYKNALQTYLDFEAENIDFSRNEEAANKINNWAKEATNGLIPTAIDSKLLNALTRLVLINAIYFKGNWRSPFNPNNTQKKDFYITKDNTVEVNMMYQKGYFKYAEYPDLELKAVLLPYKNANYSHLFIVPTSENTFSVNDLVKKLDYITFTTIIKGLRNVQVMVYLPSIHTSTTTDLSKIIKAVNITRIFNPTDSGIDRMLKNNTENIFVSAAIQKADITINELGSEAAAVNVITVSATAVLANPNIFEANRPYVYFILHLSNDANGDPEDNPDILFCGSYTGT